MPKWNPRNARLVYHSNINEFHYVSGKKVRKEKKWLVHLNRCTEKHLAKFRNSS